MARLRIRFPQNHKPHSAPVPTLRVDPKGDWKSCTGTIPKDCEVIGTVTSEGVTGALVRLAGTRNFVKVVDGNVAMVSTIKVQQALAAHRNREVQRALEMIPVEGLD